MTEIVESGEASDSRITDVLVVIPTLHNVDRVLAIVSVMSQCKCSLWFIIVDNGAAANSTDWPQNVEVIIDNIPTGSTGFLKGMQRFSGSARWVLFLDDDAGVDLLNLQRLIEIADQTSASLASAIGLGPSTNGRGAGWANVSRFSLCRFSSESKSFGVSSHESSLVAIDLLPWSGLLLPLNLLRNVSGESLEKLESMFFSWDDYLFCHILRRDYDLTLFGVRECEITNVTKDFVKSNAWRSFYFVRNGMLFCSETGSSVWSWSIYLWLGVLVSTFRSRSPSIRVLLLAWQGWWSWARWRFDNTAYLLPSVSAERRCGICGSPLYFWRLFDRVGDARNDRVALLRCSSCKKIVCL